jgi:hypothetical protein
MSEEIRCPNCGVLYGMYEDGVLTIKYRDLFRYVKGGTVSGPCRGCKTTVEWPQRPKEPRSDDPTTR